LHLDPNDPIEFTSRNISKMDGDPVRAALADAVAHGISIIRKSSSGESYGAILGQLVGVKEDAWCTIQGILHVQNTRAMQILD
jgi:hypothetical protein